MKECKVGAAAYIELGRGESLPYYVFSREISKHRALVFSAWQGKVGAKEKRKVPMEVKSANKT